MAKIQTYNQSTTVNNLGNVSSAPSVSVGNPYGQGLSAIGQGVTNIGNQQAQDQISGMQLDREAARYQQQQADEAAKLTAVKAASDLQLQWMQELPKREQATVGAGTGFTQSTLADLDKNWQEVIKTNDNPAAKKYLEYEYLQQRNAVAGRSIQFENQKFQGYKLEQIDGTIQNNANIILSDSTQYQAAKAKTYAAIDASGVSEDVKIKLKDQADKQYLSAGMNNKINNDPMGTLDKLRPTVGELKEGSVAAQVANISNQLGGNALYTVAVAGIESDFATNAASKSSSAKGLFQFTNTTGGQYGVTKDSTMQQQVEAFTKLTNDNKLQLTANLGRNPTDSELYLAHHFGAGGAQKLLRADPNAAISSVVSADVMKSNDYLKGKTVQQVIDINNKKYTQLASKYAAPQSSDPIINALPAHERAQYLKQAENAVSTINTQRFNQFENMARDQIAAAGIGKPPTTLMTPDMFRTPEQYSIYQKSIDIGQKISTVNQMTPAEEMQLYNSYGYKQEQGAAVDIKMQEQLGQAIQAKHQAIQSDSAAWAINNDPEVQKYASIMQVENTPENLVKYNTAIIAAQQKQGVQQPKLLTKPQVAQAAAVFKQGNGASIVQEVENLKNQYGKDFGLVNAQLAMDPAYPAAVIPISNIANPNIQQRIAAGANLSQEELTAGYDQATKALLTTEANTAIAPFLNSMPMNQTNSKIRDGYNHAMQTLSYDYMRQGFKYKSAVEHAAKDLLSEYTIEPNIPTKSITTRIPNTENPTQVINGAKYALKKFDTTGTNIPTNYKDSLIKKAVWVTSPDETGLQLNVLDVDNIIKPVARNGKPIIYLFSDLRTIVKD